VALTWITGRRAGRISGAPARTAGAGGTYAGRMAAFTFASVAASISLTP
jgi:hypothetical protein